MKIDTIKKFAVFEDFTWSESLPNFEKYNLIYGWNYTGKTSLSRIFQCFERQERHEDYPNAEFVFETEKGLKSSSDLTQVIDIRVFNIDFIDRNLKWHQQDDEIQPIFILGEQNIELQERLSSKANELKVENESLVNLAGETGLLQQNLIKSLSERASNIKNLLSIVNFDKNRFIPYVESAVLKNDENKILTDDALQRAIRSYQDTNVKEGISFLILLKIDSENLYQRTEELLVKKPIAETIEKLLENTELNRWVEHGKDLHKDSDNCKFCGNKLPADLIGKLEKHFSDDLSKLRTEINLLKDQIDQKIKVINEIDVRLIDKARFYDDFQLEYENLKGILKNELAVSTEYLENLKACLVQKSENPFEELTPRDLRDFEKTEVEVIRNIVEKINQVIDKHNAKTNNFNSERELLKEKLIQHFAHEFINDTNYIDNQELIKEQEKLISEKKTLICELKSEIVSLENRLSENANGAKKVNEYLQILFNSDNLVFETNEKGLFKLLRDNKPAKNLSEGEKTAISFAYFIASLEDKNTNLSETVVFIDDPISSLDSNHLYNVYSFIRERLGDNQCKQLFISTHNLEFFNLVKDFIKEKLKLQNNNKLDEAPFYFIERTHNKYKNSSSIKKLPWQLKKFKSEYIYLFYLIHKFYKNPSAEFEQHYILGNIIRKFLEAYLGMKCPDSKSWSSKLHFLIDEKIQATRIEKFVHNYSHSGSSESFIKHSDINECSQIIKNIVECLELKDKEHYNALCSNFVSFDDPNNQQIKEQKEQKLNQLKEKVTS
ncbi:MAG: AAA family ATPase [Cyanobacteria bacterium]|nr:AAA family ATPase [Cyanobacteriota bacterium]